MNEERLWESLVVAAITHLGNGCETPEARAWAIARFNFLMEEPDAE